MNGSSPFLNLYFTRGSKHDLKPNQKWGGGIISDRGVPLIKGKQGAQLAIHDMSNHDVPCVHLTLDAHFRSVVLRFPFQVEICVNILTWVKRK